MYGSRIRWVDASNGVFWSVQPAATDHLRLLSLHHSSKMLAMSGSTAGRSMLCKNAVASCSYISTHQASTLATRKHEPSAPRRKKAAAGEETERRSSTLIGRLMSLQNWGGRRGRGRGPPPNAVFVRPLKPYDVASRVTQLIKEDRLEHAIEMVNNLPRQAQDVVVWNLLIAEAMTKWRFTRGFEIYYDVSRPPLHPYVCLSRFVKPSITR